MKSRLSEVYLYIGITSLYLYNSAGTGNLQDGILHKKVGRVSCKGEKMVFSDK